MELFLPSTSPGGREAAKVDPVSADVHTRHDLTSTEGHDPISEAATVSQAENYPRMAEGSPSKLDRHIALRKAIRSCV